MEGKRREIAALRARGPVVMVGGGIHDASAPAALPRATVGLKAVFLATTLTGVTDLRLAILADTGAIVTLNALHLLRQGTRRRLPS